MTRGTSLLAATSLMGKPRGFSCFSLHISWFCSLCLGASHFGDIQSTALKLSQSETPRFLPQDRHGFKACCMGMWHRDLKAVLKTVHQRKECILLHFSIWSTPWKWVESVTCRGFKCLARTTTTEGRDTREKRNARCKVIAVSERTWEFPAPQTSPFKEKWVPVVVFFLAQSRAQVPECREGQ